MRKLPQRSVACLALLLVCFGCSSSKPAGDLDGGDAAGGNGGAGGAAGGNGGAGGAAGMAGVNGPGIADCGGTMTCAPPTICCESASGGMCVDAANGPGSCYGGSGILVSCDGPEDCPGNVCCFVLSPYVQNPGPPSIKCATADLCTQVICRVAADCPSSAPVCCAKGASGTMRARCTPAADCM